MARLALALLVLMAAAAPAATATAPEQLFDAPGQKHAVVCAQLAASPAPLRFGDGSATGFDLTDRLSFVDSRCADGSLRLDLHELIPSSAGPLAFHRGGNGYRDDGDVKYGELAVSDLAGPLPAPVPSSGGRGAACEVAAGSAYRVSVRSIPAAMHYKRPQDVVGGSNTGTSFRHYGDPAADQGSRDDVHYTYLLWSFLDVLGGGTARTLLAPVQLVQPCDVEPATMSSWDSAGAVNGEVTARYVRVLAGSCPLYGWMVWDHTYYPRSQTPVVHATAAPDARPPDPQPDPACPVAAPASPPLVATGGSAPAADGAVTLEGTVNPVGATGSYRFEYGPGSGYGAITADMPVSAADRDVSVAAGVDGLAPGAAYHYRLVATTTHGTTYGGDRTLIVGPPAPAMLSRPAPLMRAAAVRALRVAPRAFRRARSRRGAPARIRLRMSGRALVKFTFERRNRRGRWAAVRGSLRRTRAAGTSLVRFGGWLGHRPLAAGSYRLTATPSGPGRLRGKSRHTRFTLRPRAR